MLQKFPFRYVDRSVFHPIREVDETMGYVQIKGILRDVKQQGNGPKTRLTAQLQDGGGIMELVWFKGAQYIKPQLKIGAEYVAYGRPNVFKSRMNMPHPELDLYTPAFAKDAYLQPIYPSTERMKNSRLDTKGIAKIMRQMIDGLDGMIEENLPLSLLEKYRLINRCKALKDIHFPASMQALKQAQRRLKFEELFMVQLEILSNQEKNKKSFQGHKVKQLSFVHQFYKDHLPFELTNAQKRVLREIYEDMNQGTQMNRLLQGDVGSGKTMVAFISMLMCISNDFQTCIMAPTEILAEQHFSGLSEYAEKMGLRIVLLTGSTKTTERKALLADLAAGELPILVGTHALLEDRVVF